MIAFFYVGPVLSLLVLIGLVELARRSKEPLPRIVLPLYTISLVLSFEVLSHSDNFLGAAILMGLGALVFPYALLYSIGHYPLLLLPLLLVAGLVATLLIRPKQLLKRPFLLTLAWSGIFYLTIDCAVEAIIRLRAAQITQDKYQLEINSAYGMFMESMSELSFYPHAVISADGESCEWSFKYMDFVQSYSTTTSDHLRCMPRQ